MSVPGEKECGVRVLWQMDQPSWSWECNPQQADDKEKEEVCMLVSVCQEAAVVGGSLEGEEEEEGKVLMVVEQLPPTRLFTGYKRMHRNDECVCRPYYE